MLIVSNPYELLIRWNIDGSLSGAHVMERMVGMIDPVPPSNTSSGVQMQSDGVTPVLNAIQMPTPLDTAGTAFTALIGTALSASQAQVTVLTAQVAALQAQVATLQAN